MSVLPKHIAIVMDGNGRWAKRRGMPRIAGHKRGVESVRNLVDVCGQRGIEYLTLFAFSSENWRRPRSEVDFLMELLVSTLENEVKKLHENGIQLKIIGDLDRFGTRIQKLVSHARELTFHNKKLTLTVAINYGGRWDITQTIRSIGEKIACGEVLPSEITEHLVNQEICTADTPDPDLFIRTGGETRISNFLLWQLAYTELYFTDVLWPDFDTNQLELALKDFSGRQRRFGKTSEQILAK